MIIYLTNLVAFCYYSTINNNFINSGHIKSDYSSENYDITNYSTQKQPLKL